MVVHMFSKQFIILLIIPMNVISACSSNSNDDWTIIKDPTFGLTFNPPAGWTYPLSTAEETWSFFPGQPLTLAQAQNAAAGDFKGAVFQALEEAGQSAENVVITITYTPPELHDCYKNDAAAADLVSLPIGGKFALFENGVISQIATVTGAALASDVCRTKAYAANQVILTYEPEIEKASIKIENFQAAKFILKQISSMITANLVFGRGVKFVSENTIS
uniref:DUF1795 domain-containing protein n=1 Tax=Rhabditophanes sp. KR3021 TaxID=114890 RepID=A0AC35U7F0_9BILA